MQVLPQFVSASMIGYAFRIVCLTTGFTISLLAMSCAVPVAPTGGPVDKSPPILESLSPSADAVNVELSTRKIRFDFSEYMNEASFAQAFSISPEPATPPRITWKKRTATVALEEDLLANTTYVLTIDKRLSDANNNKLSSPKTVAFSTGPTISRATITGSVLDSRTGKGLEDSDVFAYAIVPDSVFRAVPERPRYRTQTNESGRFDFEYLTEGDYVIVANVDANGNRRPDVNETVGFTTDIVTSASESVSNRVRLAAFRFDNEAPSIRRVRSTANTNTIVRFSEK